MCFNSSPNNNFLDWTKLKAFADEILNVDKSVISVFDGVENIMGKGENITSIFTLSHSVFKRLLYQGRQKSGFCGKELTVYYTTMF